MPTGVRQVGCRWGVDVGRRGGPNSTSSPLWLLCAVFASKGKVTMDRDEYNVNGLDLPKYFDGR